jgi:hypothetical protein
MNSGPAVARKIGLLSNPHSRRNRAQLGSIADIVANHPAIDHQITTSADEVAATLTAFANTGVNVLAINGGDGTTAQVFTALLKNRPFQSMPEVILLPGGTTNMNAGDVGLRGKLGKAVKQMSDWADHPEQAAQRLTRPILRVDGAVDASPIYGMFFGTGTIISGIEYCKDKIHTLGIRDELAPGVMAVRTIWGLIRKEPYFSDPTSIQIDINGNADATSRPVIQLLITSLDRLFLGARPFWGQEDAPLHCTWIEKPTRKILRAFPAVLRGNTHRHLTPGNGYFSHNAERIQLLMDGQFALDGEMHRASRQQGPITISNGGNIDFLRMGHV